jgi:hypothetical protein
LADDINVNLNLRNQSTGNVPDTPTLAGNKQLASALERSLKPLLKNIEKSTTESFKSAMKNYARPASTGSGKSSGAAYADFDKALKDGFDGFGRHAADNGVRRHIFGDYRTRGNHRALPHGHAICDDCARSQPDIILNSDAFGGDALVYEGGVGVIENVVDGDDLGEGGGV